MILKNCNACIINGAEPDVRVKARVNCIDEKIILYFDDKNVLGMKTDRLEVDFCDSQIGFVKTYCELEIRKNTDPYVLEPWTADCQILEMVEIIQRQKDLRVRLVKEVTFISPVHGHFTGIIQNISVGGIYLTTGTRLAVDDEITFEYYFSKNPHEIRAKVLRETFIRDNHYGYGCQFIDVPNGVEREIRQFVYRQQLNKMW